MEKLFVTRRIITIKNVVKTRKFQCNREGKWAVIIINKVMLHNEIKNFIELRYEIVDEFASQLLF